MTNEPRNSDELVERLLRIADPGPEIPFDGATRIKRAVRPVWRDEVRRRNAKRWAVWGAALGAAASLAVFFLLPRPNAPPGQPAGSIELTRGRVDVEPRDDRGGIAVGSRITTDATSRAALRLASGASLRLDVGTSVEILSPRTVGLDRGAVYIDSAGARDLVEVRTDLGVARDIGTQFEVRREGESLVVRVREGAVALRAEREEVRVESGTQLALARDGSHQTSPIAADAPEWSWIHAVATPFPIEGRSVASFLTWVSRETGAPIRFEDREAERIAATTVLHGSLGELRPDEAPEVILPSAGLEARLDPSGALVVTRLPAMERK